MQVITIMRRCKICGRLEEIEYTAMGVCINCLEKSKHDVVVKTKIDTNRENIISLIEDRIKEERGKI